METLDPYAGRNPYELDDALSEDGISLYDDRPWAVQAEEHRERMEAWEAHPKIDAESPHIHFAHDCEPDAPFVLSRCGIALDRHAQREPDAVSAEARAVCAGCLAAALASPACPQCGELT